MRKQRHLLSRTTALLLAASLIPPAAAYAETGQRLIALVGDITDDMLVTGLDVLFLGSYLCLNPNGLRRDLTPEKCDLDENGTVDAIDLTLLKRQKISGDAPKAIYETYEIKPIVPPVSALKPSLPSVGEARILTFAVSFPDCGFDLESPAEMVQEYCFGEEDTDSMFYPMESVPAYYSRASYGRLRLQGDVFAYTAKNPLADYTVNNAEALTEEILAAFAPELDYQKYDADGDRILDSVVLMLPEDALKSDSDGDKKPDWWPFSVPYSGNREFDGITPGTYCVTTVSLDVADTNCHLAHELGHAMGMPDYYKIHKDETFETQGLPGFAGIELMDDGSGDLSAFSKLMLGWIAEGELQVYTGGEQTFILNSMQQMPSCLMIPRNKSDGYLSEFFLVEYLTNEGNNAACFTDGFRTRYTPRSGVRILHCQAEVKEGAFGPEFRYNDRSSEYDVSNQKQRVLRIVNDADFLSNEPVTAEQPGFHWYAEDGTLSVDPELTVKRETFYCGPAFDWEKWLEQYGSESQLNHISDPSYLDGSRYVIRVSGGSAALH
ncbi:MAG: hypothetical protein IJL32_03220 [Oscillospiraceae bacterium]|nr:hypothetical protein [Oscillospiraceae bacterium]